MGTDVAEIVDTDTPPPPCTVKVHVVMCAELRKLVDAGCKILPEIEAARPGGSSGVQALCLLSNAIEKAKLVIEDCCNSSKLYLAITGDVILSRCKKTRKSFNQSLNQIQYLVPAILASEISEIIYDLSGVTFGLDMSEEEAGNVLKTLLQQYASGTDSNEGFAIQSIQIAASRLHITSPKAILIEKRSIKRLLDKVGDSADEKKKILMFLLNLLKKYEKVTARRELDNVCVQHEESNFSASSPDQYVETEFLTGDGPDLAQIDMLSRPTPPKEFRCPLSSKVMYDPVIIDSGQTFERMFIEKWFSEGHDACPKTKRKLSHLSLTPNVTMKDLISKWCIAYGVTIPDPLMQSESIHSREASLTAIASLSSSLCNLSLPKDFSNVSLGYLDRSQASESSSLQIADTSDSMIMKTDGDSKTLPINAHNHTRDNKYLHKLDALPWESQCKMVEDLKIRINDDNHAIQFVSQEYLVEPLTKFLEKALDLNDLKAQRAGCSLLLAFVTKSRSSGQYLNEGVYLLLASFFDSEVIEEVICIVEVLSYYQCCRTKIAASGVTSSIIRILEIQIRELCEPATRILYNLSLDHKNHPDLLSTDIICKLAPYLEDSSLARYCIALYRNLCDHEIIREIVAETDGCISSIAKMLEMDDSENQEHAVFVLLSLCSHHDLYCHLVMDEGVIPSLVSISVNGNENAKASAMELLRLFRDRTDKGNMQECPESDQNPVKDSGDAVKEQKPSAKPWGFFRKITVFLKSTQNLEISSLRTFRRLR